LVDRPLTGAEAGAGPITCTLTPQIGALGLQLDLTVPALGPDEVLAIETDDPAIWVSPPVLRRDGAHLTALSDMIHAENDSFAFNRSTLRVTLIGNGQAIEMIGCAAG
ncbi:MAG: hypothetical protein JKX69_07070, partial [Rhodobacteraceae bacterium]|nr:hypothetical protein [Paracoccaceae bacterium]